MTDLLEESDPSRRVTVVAVCYNSNDVLPEMLASVPDGVPVVLVDNASADAAALMDVAQPHGVSLIRNDDNKGFGVACNQGAERTGTEFILFLNPDARLLPDTLDLLVAAADRYPDASGMNPRIAGGDDRPAFKRSSILAPRSEWMPRGWPAGDCEVPFLSGAALFVRRAAFEAVGGFDPNIFLYHEDDDLSRRLKDQCGPIYFVHDPLVTHIGGSSSVRSPEVAALKAWHMGRSRVYVMRKHRRPLPRLRSLGSALLQICSPVALLSRRKRAKQMAFLKGVMSA